MYKFTFYQYPTQSVSLLLHQIPRSDPKTFTYWKHAHIRSTRSAERVASHVCQ